MLSLIKKGSFQSRICISILRFAMKQCKSCNVISWYQVRRSLQQTFNGWAYYKVTTYWKRFFRYDDASRIVSKSRILAVNPNLLIKGELKPILREFHINNYITWSNVVDINVTHAEIVLLKYQSKVS